MLRKALSLAFIPLSFFAATLPRAARAAEIAVTQGLNGFITPGSTIVATGASQKFTFTPRAGYTLDKAIVDGAPAGVVSAWPTVLTQGANKYVRSIAYLGGGVLVAVGDTILRSTDYGRTWTNVAPARVSAIFLKVISAGNGVAIIGATGGKIFRSVDNGVTWTDLGGKYGQTHVYGLASLGRGVILAGTTKNWTSGLLLRSTDYGATWSNRGNLGAERNIIALEYLPMGVNSGAVLAGTAGGPGGSGNIWRSTDLGLTWTNLGNKFGALVTDVDFFGYLGKGVTVASTYANAHMLRSTDYGLTWRDLGRFDAGDKLSGVATAGNGIAIVGGGTGGHLWRSTDYGASWTDLGRQGAETDMRPAYVTNGIFLSGSYPNGKILRVGGYGLANPTSYTFANVRANHRLTARFVPIAPVP